MTKWQRVTIRVDKRYGPEEREAIGIAICDFIRYRTQELGVDKNNRRFAKYSKRYAESLNFQIARKSKSKVDLTMTGDMLAMLDVLSHRPGAIVIGYERGSPENGVADGNIRGTYGQSSQVGPKRDFLGITKGDLERILDNFPLDDKEESLDTAETILDAASGALALVGLIEPGIPIRNVWRREQWPKR